MSTDSTGQLPKCRLAADDECDATNDKRHASVTHALVHRDIVVDVPLLAAEV